MIIQNSYKYIQMVHNGPFHIPSIEIPYKMLRYVTGPEKILKNICHLIATFKQVTRMVLCGVQEKPSYGRSTMASSWHHHAWTMWKCQTAWKLHEICMKIAWKLHEIIMKSAWILHEYFYRFGCVVDICWKQHENNIASQNLTTSSQYHHSNMSSAFSSRFCFLDWPIARKSSACILVNKRYSRTSVSWWSIHHKDNSVDHTNT